MRSGAARTRASRSRAKAVVAGFRVDVVVAGAVVPGDAGSAQDLQVARIERQVVEHDVAVIDAERCAASERSRRRCRRAGRQAPRRSRAGCRRAVRPRTRSLLLAPERKVDGGRQRAGRCNAGVAIGDVARAALRAMQTGECRHPACPRARPMRRLDHEDAVAVCNRQPPAALRVGQHHVAAVRDHHAGYPGVADPAPAGPAAIVENMAAGNARPLRKRGPRGQRQGRGTGARDDPPSRRQQARPVLTRHWRPSAVRVFKSPLRLRRACDSRVAGRCGLRDSCKRKRSRPLSQQLHTNRLSSSGVNRHSAGPVVLRTLCRLSTCSQSARRPKQAGHRHRRVVRALGPPRDGAVGRLSRPASS